MGYFPDIDHLNRHLVLHPCNLFINIIDRQVNIVQDRKMRIQFIKRRQLNPRESKRRLSTTVLLLLHLFLLLSVFLLSIVLVPFHIEHQMESVHIGASLQLFFLGRFAIVDAIPEISYMRD